MTASPSVEEVLPQIFPSFFELTSEIYNERMVYRRVENNAAGGSGYYLYYDSLNSLGWVIADSYTDMLALQFVVNNDDSALTPDSVKLKWQYKTSFWEEEQSIVAQCKNGK